MTTEATMTTERMNEAESGSAVRLHPVVRAPFYSDEYVTLYHGNSVRFVTLKQRLTCAHVVIMW